MSAFHGKLLLIDNNPEFLEEVQKDIKLIADYPLCIQKTLKDGLKLLGKNRGTIRTVIVSSAFFKTEVELLNFKAEIGETPYVFISHKENHHLRGHFKANKNIPDPKSYNEILNFIRPLFEQKANWKEFELSKDEKFVELQLVDSDYVALELKDFMIFPQSYFNIYIKIGRGNFIKVVNAGDESAKEVLARYAEKVQHVYLPLKEHEKYLALCEKISTKSFSLRNTFRLGNEVVRNIQRLGIEAKSLDYAESFLNQSVGLIKNFNIKDGELLKFIQHIENNEHSTAVSFLAGVFANELGFESMKSVKLVGVAALVHDIGLFHLVPDTDEKNLSPFSDLMMNHAKQGANLLRASGCFDEVVCLAVEQHHLRKRSSDPLFRENNMNLVSEIVGVSDCFFNSVVHAGFDQKNLDYFLLVELKKFSHQIEKGVLAVLDKKRKAG